MPINQCFKKAAGQLAPVQAMAMKAEDNLLRIAATLTLWNDHSAGAINSESVQAAAHLMDDYLTEGLRIADFSSELSDDSDLSMAADLLKWAKANGFYRSKTLMKVLNLTRHKFNPATDVYIGRKNPRYGMPQSKWHNRYKVGKADYTRTEALRRYKADLLADPELMASLPELKGKNLVCWCDPLPCHGHILRELVEGLP